MQKEITFKKNKEGRFELFYDHQNLGISFIVSKDYDIKDYNISILGGVGGTFFRPCKDLVIELVNSPKETEKIAISTTANIISVSELTIKIGKSLELFSNENTLFINAAPDEGEKNKKSLFFDRLSIEDNKNTTLFFNNHKHETVYSEAEYKEYTKTFKDKVFTIKGNKNINFGLCKESLCLELIDNRTSIPDVDVIPSIVFDSPNVSFEKNKIRQDDADQSFDINFISGSVQSKEGTFFLAKNLYIKNLSEKAKTEPLISIKKAKIYATYGPNGEIRNENAYLIMDSTNFSAKEGSEIEISDETNIITNGGNIDVLKGECYFDGGSIRTEAKSSLVIQDLKLINNSTIHFVSDKDFKNGIKQATFEKTNLSNVRGTISGFLKDTLADGLTFGDRSQIIADIPADGKFDTNYEFHNLVLKENSTLKMLPTYENKFMVGIEPRRSQCYIENSVFEGFCDVQGDLHFKASNSIFSDFLATFSKEPYQVDIKNSTFAGACNFWGIKSIDSSSIKNSNLSFKGGKVEINGEFLEDVKDYKEYRAQRPTLESESKITLNDKDLELL
jgi:hypothetical protein